MQNIKNAPKKYVLNEFYTPASITALRLSSGLEKFLSKLLKINKKDYQDKQKNYINTRTMELIDILDVPERSYYRYLKKLEELEIVKVSYNFYRSIRERRITINYEKIERPTLTLAQRKQDYTSKKVFQRNIRKIDTPPFSIDKRVFRVYSGYMQELDQTTNNFITMHKELSKEIYTHLWESYKRNPEHTLFSALNAPITHNLTKKEVEKIVKKIEYEQSSDTVLQMIKKLDKKLKEN